jgi:hypothetical protein
MDAKGNPCLEVCISVKETYASVQNRPMHQCIRCVHYGRKRQSVSQVCISAKKTYSKGFPPFLSIQQGGRVLIVVGGVDVYRHND